MNENQALQNMRLIRDRYAIPLRLNEDRYAFLPSDIAEIRDDLACLLPLFDSICAGDPHSDELMLTIARSLPRIEHLAGHLAEFRDRTTELLDAAE